MIWTEAPSIRCHVCCERFNHSSHWALHEDDVVFCAKCGAELKLVAEETVRRWSWSPVAETGSASE